MTFSRSNFLVLSSFFLLIWFRFEAVFHSHWALSGLLLFCSLLLFVPLVKSMRDKTRYVVAALWLFIICVLAAGFIQSAFLNRYSESRFQKKIEEVTDVVQRRAKTQLLELRNHAEEVAEELNSSETFNATGLFVHLQDNLGEVPYGWAVYDSQGALLSWKGQFPQREIQIVPESEEITVYNALHQQFLRLKRMFIVRQTTFMIVVNEPIAADYGIENKYLQNYNLLTDDLPIRPDLLYNSQVTTAGSSDLIIKNLRMAPDFSIAVLFKKGQYSEFLDQQNFMLRWWFELAALLYMLFGIVYSFFEFIGLSGQNVSRAHLWRAWLVIVFIGLFGLILVSEFSSLGSSSFLDPAMSASGGLFETGSPGGLLITSFVMLNVIWSFAVLLWKLDWRLAFRSAWLNYAFLLAACVLSGLLIELYFDYAKSTLMHGPFDPIGQPLFQVIF